MSYWQFILFFLKRLGISFGWLIFILPPIILYNICWAVAHVFHIDEFGTIITGFSIVQFLAFLYALKDGINEFHEQEVFRLSQERKKFEYEMRERRRDAERELSAERRQLRDEVREQKLQLKKELSDEKNQLRLKLSLAKKEYSEQADVLRNEFKKLKEQLHAENENIKTSAEKRVIDAEKRTKEMYSLLTSSTPFSSCAKMMADIFITHYTSSVSNLRYKPHPAIKAADEVKELRTETRECITRMKALEYKLSYVVQHFPKIGEYLDNDEDLLAIGKHTSYSELDDLRDRRKDYLSTEEYNLLSEAEKSQLALDRYIKGIRKDKWQIGRDYEMSCAFQLKSRGYHVEMHGIKYKECDLGRDIVAIKNMGGLFGNEVLIIQCKNWSSKHVIHENVIMQLFGTTIEYQITFPNVPQYVVPVLMIPPYSIVSDIAMRFAEKLKVRIERFENLDFPRIKCNINNGSKIYHLPFDQQYDRTEIKNKGECYAYTVAEAESKGFRRAMRHTFTN